MGEYFKWVNVDKKEYIAPIEFDDGSKFTETSNKNCTTLLVLHTLLFDRWAKDHILFLGDECHLPENTDNYVYKTLTNQYNAHMNGGYIYDMVYETYRNVSGYFCESESEVRQEIGYYLEDIKNGVPNIHNVYGIDINHPFEGLFTMTGKRYPYVLNHTKKVYYSLEQTKILHLDQRVSDTIDPLPSLLGHGRTCSPGLWIGDSISVSDQICEGYNMLEKIYLDF